MTLPAQDIVERLLDAAERATRTRAERYREAADTISRLTADNEALRKERDEAIAKRESADGMDGAVVHAIREVLYAGEVPVAPFIDDHVGNAIVQRNQERARADALAQEVERLRTNLETRDKFIVNKDLWGEFVAQLDAAALGDRP